MSRMREGAVRGLATAAVVLLLLALHGPTPAQVTPGWLAASSFRDASGLRTGPGGIWLVHPTASPGVVVQVTNMPLELTGVLYPTSNAGANCLTWCAGDEAVVVGEFGPTGATIGLQRLYLQMTYSNGQWQATVTQAQRTVLGTVTNQFGGGVHSAVTLPNQDVLFATFGLSNGPLVGILQFGTGLVVPLQVQFPATFVPGLNALAVNSTGTTAYVGCDLGNAMDLYRIPLSTPPTPTVATRISTVPLLANALVLDPTDSRLTMVGIFYGTNHVIELDLTTNQQTACTGMVRYNGAALEEDSGALVTAAGNGSGYEIYRMTSPCGAATLLAPAPVGGWGVTSGVVAIPALRRFGHRTAHANAYSWEVRPNPGGMPSPGNLNFGLTVTGSPTATTGIWALSFGALPAPVQAFGADIWIDLSGPHAIGLLIPQGAVACLPLPIPNLSALCGMEFAAQTIHDSGLVPTPLDASSGLRFWIH